MSKIECVIYARVSESRTSAESMSCEAQIDACQAYIASKREPEWEILEIFQDHSVSGKSMDNRPGLQSAVETACKRKAAFVVYALSRFSRSILDCLKTVDTLNKAGANFVCLKENFDTSTPSGRMVFYIFAALQQFEREIIAQRTSDAMKSYMKAGLKMSSQPLYGFAFDGDRMIPNPTEQAAVKRLIELRNLGLGYGAIGKQLEVEGHKARGQKFHRLTIRRILRHSQEG